MNTFHLTRTYVGQSYTVEVEYIGAVVTRMQFPRFSYPSVRCRDFFLREARSELMAVHSDES